MLKYKAWQSLINWTRNTANYSWSSNLSIHQYNLDIPTLTIMKDKYYISKRNPIQERDRRKSFKPTIGDLHINGCCNTSSWNVVEVVKVNLPYKIKNGKIYSWNVDVRDIRTNQIYSTQVSLPIFKSPIYKGRRDCGSI